MEKTILQKTFHLFNVRFFFAPHDFWIGLFYRQTDASLFVCILPTLCIHINPLAFYENDIETVIAYSPDDAAKVWSEQMDETYDPEDHGGPWTRSPLYRKETLNYPDHTMEEIKNDPSEYPKGSAISQNPYDGYPRVTARQTSWIRYQGRSYFGSTEY